jgi:hypothetical protein
MATRILYLHYRHVTFAGQGATLGKKLVRALEHEFGQVIEAHVVDDDDALKSAHRAYTDDAVGYREILREGTNVIYCEGGMNSSLADDTGRRWKVKLEHAEEFVRDGGVLVVADIDRNDAAKAEDSFTKFCGFDFRYDDQMNRNPIYFTDMAGDCRYGLLIKIDTAQMYKLLAEWLWPVYEGIAEILVDGPVEIHPSQDSLGFVVSETAGSLCLDQWWSAPSRGPLESGRLYYHPKGPGGPDFLGPFASVRKMGRGFVAAITGLISTDRLVTSCPGNAVWIRNLIRHLQASAHDRPPRNAFILNRGVCLFLSHRSADKPIVSAVSEELRKQGVRVWFDSDRILPSDSLGIALGGGLSECSHFVLFWSRNCIEAPWVDFEIGEAISACITQKKRIFVVALDDMPVRSPLAQFVRIDGTLSPEQIAAHLTEAVLALKRRDSASR